MLGPAVATGAIWPVAVITAVGWGMFEGVACLLWPRTTNSSTKRTPIKHY